MLTQPNKMMVAAHRGDSYNFSENTMTAFREAIVSGADMIETDVHLSIDGIPVLMHDADVIRTSNGSGKIAEMTFEELRQLDVGGGECIPTLEELLQVLSETNVTLNLELKVYSDVEGSEKCEACIDRCVQLIEQYHMRDRMVFNSFDAYALEYIARRYHELYRLHGFYPYSAMRNVQQNPDEYLYCACIWGKHLPEHYAYLIEHGIEPWIGASVTQERVLNECFKMGARLVTTNFPSDTIRKLERLQAR